MDGAAKLKKDSGSFAAVMVQSVELPGGLLEEGYRQGSLSECESLCRTAEGILLELAGGVSPAMVHAAINPVHIESIRGRCPEQFRGAVPSSPKRNIAQRVALGEAEWSVKYEVVGSGTTVTIEGDDQKEVERMGELYTQSIFDVAELLKEIDRLKALNMFLSTSKPAGSSDAI